MKKLLSLVLALMIATVACAAFAEAPAAAPTAEEEKTADAEEASAEKKPAEGQEVSNEAAVALNWPEYEKALKEKGWSGDFVVFDEVGLKMFMPGIFSAFEITEEDKANNMIAFYATDDESAAVAVYNTTNLTHEAQDLKKQLLDTKIVDKMDDILLNGQTGLIGSNAEDDVLVLMVKGEKNWITIHFAPASDEGFVAVAQVMMASVQPSK